MRDVMEERHSTGWGRGVARGGARERPVDDLLSVQQTRPFSREVGIGSWGATARVRRRGRRIILEIVQDLRGRRRGGRSRETKDGNRVFDLRKCYAHAGGVGSSSPFAAGMFKLPDIGECTVKLQ